MVDPEVDGLLRTLAVGSPVILATTGAGVGGMGVGDGKRTGVATGELDEVGIAIRVGVLVGLNAIIARLPPTKSKMAQTSKTTAPTASGIHSRRPNAPGFAPASFFWLG